MLPQRPRYLYRTELLYVLSYWYACLATCVLSGFDAMYWTRHLTIVADGFIPYCTFIIKISILFLMYYCTCELNLHFRHRRSPVLTGVNFIGVTATILILLVWQFQIQLSFYSHIFILLDFNENRGRLLVHGSCHQ